MTVDPAAEAPKKKANHRVPLDYDVDDRRDFAHLAGMLGREWGIVGSIEQIVLRAMREAAQRT